MKEAEVQLFVNPTLGELQAVMIGDQPWVVAADVCRALDLTNPTDRLRSLDADEKLTYLLHRAGQIREVNLINESGLYALILRSNKPQARALRKWVTSEVLPALRRTGQYVIRESSSIDAPVLEWFKGFACISGGWLIRSGIITQANLSSMIHRGVVIRARRSAPGHPSLIVWESIPTRFRKRITDRYGEVRLTSPISDPRRLLSVVADVCKIDDTELRMRLIHKLLWQ